MTADWPTAHLDPVSRLHIVAAGIAGAAVTQQVVPAGFDTVWSMLTDFEGEFTRIQPDMHRVRVVSVDGENVTVLAVSRLGLQARLHGVARTGWCWLQSRNLIIAMAAQPAPGGTVVALTGGIRIPFRRAILPLGVRRESRRSLVRLARLLDEHPLP